MDEKAIRDTLKSLNPRQAEMLYMKCDPGITMPQITVHFGYSDKGTSVINNHLNVIYGKFDIDAAKFNNNEDGIREGICGTLTRMAHQLIEPPNTTPNWRKWPPPDEPEQVAPSPPPQPETASTQPPPAANQRREPVVTPTPQAAPEPTSASQPALGGRVVIPDPNQTRGRRPKQIRAKRPNMLIPILLTGIGIVLVLLLIFGLVGLTEGVGRLTNAISSLLDRVGITETEEEPTEEVEEAQTQTGAVDFRDMTILSGISTPKPDTIVRGIAYPDAVYLDEGKITVRTLQEYEWLEVKAGVDDTGGLRGAKYLTILDHTGRVLFKERAEPVKEPVGDRIPISHADWVEINVLDFNGEPGQFIRILEARFIPKP